MRVVLTAAEGLPLGTAPLSLTIQEHLPPVPGPMCHSQVTVSCLEIQHFSVTLDCFCCKFLHLSSVAQSGFESNSNKPSPSLVFGEYELITEGLGFILTVP